MVSLISALEIFSNPYDLYFAVGENPNKLGIWGLAITRGPEHRGKLIVTGEGYTSKDDAIAIIIKILNICLTKGNDISFGKPKDDIEGIAKMILNPVDRKPEEMRNALTTQMVSQIEKELKSKKEYCETCAWLTLLNKDDVFAIALTDWDTVLVQSIGRDAALQMIEDNILRLTEPVTKRFKRKIKKFYTKKV